MLQHKISKRHYKNALPIGFSLIIALMVLTSIIAAIQLNKSSDEISHVEIEHRERDSLLQTMAQVARKRTITLFEIVHAADPFQIDDAYMRLNQLATDFTVTRQAFKRKKLPPNMLELFNKQTKLAQLTEPKQLQVYELARDNKKTKALDLFIKETLPLSKKFLEAIKDMSQLESSNTHIIFKDTKKNNDKTLSYLIVFDIFSVLISVLLTIFIIKKQRDSDQELALLATTDTLTTLPNRSTFIATVEDHIAENPNKPFSIIFFDIDYFKSINDNYGHEVGDKVLQDFTTKIRFNIKKEDFFARLGGDEFVLVLNSIQNHHDINQFIKKLSENLDTVFTINKTEVFTTTSMGICKYPDDGTDTETLLRHADIAMYSAKKSGRNGYKFFSKETNIKVQKEHDMSHALHSLLHSDNAGNELRLVYQPLMNISDGDFTECEALLRWTNSQGENIPTDEFIEIAEKTNLIEKINLFVIHEACKQQFEWQRSGKKSTRININLSGNKAIFSKLLYEFKINLKVFELEPSLFGIELTERTLFEISEETISELETLRELGVKISMDDFGTGYSSLSYLKKLPITTLKVDKAFISGIPNDKDDLVLVKTIINMAKSLKLEIVAEGVETHEQLIFLEAHACNIAQGYYFHHPLESDEISSLQLAA
ncbi:MAG: EAL domain-containing protein [Cocleimonas sp.]|nr:EAL domain-containing protein [Cocleimonas sp.]